MPNQVPVSRLRQEKVQSLIKVGSSRTLAALAVLVGWYGPDIAASPLANFENRTIEVHRSRKSVRVELNEKSVLCSRADYSMPMLKVLIPELAEITLLDHQNTGAGAPCVTTGQICDASGLVGPELILQGRDGVESIDVEVLAERVETVDHQQQKCQVGLRETVNTVIRGQSLTHERWADLGERSYADCVRSGAGGVVGSEKSEHTARGGE